MTRDTSRLALAAAGIMMVAAIVQFVGVRGREAESARRIAALEELAAAKASASAGERKGLLDRLEAAEKREAAALARIRETEKELEGALATAARATQDAEVERRQRALLEKRLEKETGEAVPVPAEEKPVPPKPRDPPPLGAAAITDPAQVKKLLDGLNAILALAEEKEAWSVASAEAVEGDRLLRVTLEARAREEGLTRTFEAAETRFVLRASAGTLEIILRDGKVTYPGDRSVAFPEGRYSAVLTVDAAAVRNAGHPLVVDR